MARSVVVAQATGPQGPNSPPPKVVTVLKPAGNQAITIHLDGATKLDLSANVQFSSVSLSLEKRAAAQKMQLARRPAPRRGL